MNENQNLTPEDIARLQAIRAQIILVRLFVFCIVAYGAYDYWQNPNPLGPIIWGICAWFAHSARPIMPEDLRQKIENLNS